MASMKPGTFSPSRVTWFWSVPTTLPRIVKVFCGASSLAVIDVLESSVLLQPISRKDAKRNIELRNTIRTPESMIMAYT
jgi:hypothetical protein